MIRALGLSACLLSLSCVSGPRPVSRAQLEAAAVRSHRGAFADVLRASALALQDLGFTIAEADEQAGTVVATHADGSGYQVEVRAHEGEQLVIAVPTPDRPAWDVERERTRWDSLAAATGAILEAWSAAPEWSYRADRTLALVLDAQLHVPSDWARVEPSVSRRRLTVQRLSTRKGPNPTVRLAIERRALRHDDAAELLEVARLALGAGDRLLWPDETQGQVARLLDGTVVRPVEFHRWRRSSTAWTISALAICPLEPPSGGCAEAFDELTEGFRPGAFTQAR